MTIDRLRQQQRPTYQLADADAERLGSGTAAGDVATARDGVHCELKELRANITGLRKPFYNIEEVANLVGRTAYTVRRWVKEGRLQATRASGTGPKGHLLIAREQLNNHMSLGLAARLPEAATCNS
jgi:excisionase family DNA binding protein